MLVKKLNAEKCINASNTHTPSSLHDFLLILLFILFILFLIDITIFNCNDNKYN